MTTLGSFICVRNGFELDYCFEIAAQSLLKVCDRLILCDSDSTDGTREAMDRMADRDPRITVINWAWPHPKGQSHTWFVEWLNFARRHLTADLCLYLDADEVLSDAPECHAAIREALEQRKCLAVDRLNFWRDAFSLIPDGECCGKWCVRFGPQQYECVSDEPHHKGERPIVDEAQNDGRIKIFHLGFLRKRDAFYRKARVVLEAWFNRFDPRLEAGESAKKPVWETECSYTDRLERFDGYMPESVQRWLSDRGHTTDSYLGMNEREAYQRVQISPPPPAGEPLNILVVGDLGDLLYGLAVFKAIGKVRLFARDANHLCKRLVHRMPLIGPLLLSQPYILSFEEHTDQEIHWLASEFRVHHELTRSLAWAHLEHYRGQKGLPPIKPDLKMPWITVTPDPAGHGRIIINRTNRYNNRHFRWRQIVQHYGDILLFVGTREEHAAFCSSFGTVPYQDTTSLLDVARLIYASAMFIGNQSACFAVAEGMKHLRLLEVCLEQPDVITTNDPELLLSPDGSLHLPPMAGHPALHVAPSINGVDYLRNPNTQPRTGWSYGKRHDVSYSCLKRQIMQDDPKLTDDAAHRLLFDALAEREPSYFDGGQQQAQLRLFKEALANAS